MNTNTPSVPFVMRSAWFWRRLHRILPLGQRYNPLIRGFVGRHPLVQVPWGKFNLVISGEWLDVGSSAGAPIYKQPHAQNPEFFEILAPLIGKLPTGAIVDVGANIGTYVLNFRSISSLPIIAFEPEPFLFSLLEKNVRSNQLTSLTLKNLACGDNAGTLAFQSGINGNIISEVNHIATAPGVAAPKKDAERVPLAPPNRVISVPVVRLDDALAAVGPVSLIKIDCEGFELNILRGGWNTIQQQRPVLFVELHPLLIGGFGHTLAEVCDLLEPLYLLQFWDIDASQRSSRRFARFIGRYGQELHRLAGESEMLATAGHAPKPDQLFLLGLPRAR